MNFSSGAHAVSLVLKNGSSGSSGPSDNDEARDACSLALLKDVRLDVTKSLKPSDDESEMGITECCGDQPGMMPIACEGVKERLLLASAKVSSNDTGLASSLRPFISESIASCSLSCAQSKFGSAVKALFSSLNVAVHSTVAREGVLSCVVNTEVIERADSLSVTDFELSVCALICSNSRSLSRTFDCDIGISDKVVAVVRNHLRDSFSAPACSEHASGHRNL